MTAAELMLFLDEISEGADEFKPVFKKTIGVLADYGPDMYGVLESIAFSLVDMRAAMIDRYMVKHGFTKDEAILLTLSNLQDVMKVRDSQNKK